MKVLAALVAAAALTLAGCGPNRQSTGDASTPTTDAFAAGVAAAAADATSTAPPTTPPAPASPSDARQQVCSTWANLALRLHADIDARRNDRLYTDVGMNAASDLTGPWATISDQVAYADVSFQQTVQALPSVVGRGNGDPTSWAADEQAVDQISEACGQ